MNEMWEHPIHGFGHDVAKDALAASSHIVTKAQHASRKRRWSGEKHALLLVLVLIHNFQSQELGLTPKRWWRTSLKLGYSY